MGFFFKETEEFIFKGERAHNEVRIRESYVNIT